MATIYFPLYGSEIVLRRWLNSEGEGSLIIESSRNLELVGQVIIDADKAEMWERLAVECQAIAREMRERQGDDSIDPWNSDYVPPVDNPY